MNVDPVVDPSTIPFDSNSNHNPSHFWVNLGVYQPHDTDITGLSVKFVRRQHDNKKLAIACARKNVLAFGYGFITDADLDEDMDLDSDVVEQIRDFNRDNLDISTSDDQIAILKRLRKRLATITVGAQVVVYVPAKIGILGIATVVKTVYSGEETGAPGFSTLIGIKWSFGPFYGATDTRCIQIPDFRTFTQHTGLVISQPVQPITFAQYAHVVKMLA
jgi:hypothetical protein